METKQPNVPGLVGDLARGTHERLGTATGGEGKRSKRSLVLRPRRSRPLRLIRAELAPRIAEPAPALLGPDDAGRLLCALIGRRDREHFVVLHLNTPHEVTALEVVSVGTVNSACVHPREVFKAAILSNSAAIICGHNHPSGQLTPSDEDRRVFRALEEAGFLLGIKVLDFLIVAGERWESVPSLIPNG